MATLIAKNVVKRKSLTKMCLALILLLQAGWIAAYAFLFYTAGSKLNTALEYLEGI